MLESLESIAQRLGLILISRLNYKNDDLEIKITHGKHTYPSYEKSVCVYDTKTGERLDNYGWNIFYNVPDDNIKKDLENDEYVGLLITAIVQDFPSILRRKEELEYFEKCRLGNLSALTIEAALNLKIENCQVYKLTSVTEERYYRAGRDDRFEITTIIDWFIRYEDKIMENTYLQSLLPKRIEEMEVEYVYAATAIGAEVKNFSLDTEQTQSLHKHFSKEEFVKSLKKGDLAHLENEINK
jgi:hypothetical protein